MRTEMEVLEKNGNWNVVALPREKSPVGCKWVFTVKYKADGSLERYKARFIAKGYTQTYEIDYQETFAPVAKMNTMRVLLSQGTQFELHQFDVKNVFLHGELKEEIYMDLPPDFYMHLKGKKKVFKLKKSLYGLKNSPWAWFGRFTKVMIIVGYKQIHANHTLFVKHSTSREMTTLLVYVVEIIVTGNDLEERETLKQCLAKEFKIKELGRLNYFLGIEMVHSKKEIFVS